MNWDKIKQYKDSVINFVSFACLNVLACVLVILYGSLIFAFFGGLLLIAYTGKALAIVCVAFIVCLILSLIMYQDLTLFTIICNYFAQFV